MSSSYRRSYRDPMSGHDAWLEQPYQRYEREPPPDTEDYLGRKVYVEEEDAVGVVTSWEEWEDADEDGRYGGVDLIVEFPATEYRKSYTMNMTPEAVAASPTERPEEEA